MTHHRVTHYRKCLAIMIGLFSAGLAVPIRAADTPSTPSPPTTLAQAEASYAKQDYVTALTLYQKAVADPGLDERQAGSIRSKIAICKINLTAQHQTPATAPAAPASAETQPARIPHEKPAPHEVRTLDIKQLGNFEYDPERGGGLPADVLQLNGLHVRMTGYMVPLRQATQITEFALVPSVFSCCFGAPPQVQHTIMVHCSDKSPAAYAPDLVEVMGTLKVEEKREDGFTLSLFEIDAQTVKPSELPLSRDQVSGKKPVRLELNSMK